MIDINEYPIIVIDDNRSIYDDFCKILSPQVESDELDSLESALFDTRPNTVVAKKTYNIDYAAQGEEGYKRIMDAQSAGQPYMIAFCDMRMPPGWDGLTTLEHISKQDRNIQLVICTAYSDHSFEEINDRLTNNPNVLILKKPFDSIEVRQIASSLCEKWMLNKKANLIMSDLEEMVRIRTRELEASESEVKAINESLEAEVQCRTKDLLSAKKQAEDANNAKSQFLATISHELRTPLHGILSFSNFGISKSDTASDEKKLGYFTKIHKCGSNLLRLVNTLLDLAKIEAGKMEFNFEDKCLKDLSEEVLEEFSGICLERHITFELEHTGVLLEASVDPLKIQQVIRNLVSNAVKFSPDSGRVKISLTCSDEYLLLRVSDQGKGIPGDELLYIFDKFSQASTVKEATGGTGLGLAISRQIVDAHKGQIWAENNSDTGASFVFSLPLKQKIKKVS